MVNFILNLFINVLLINIQSIINIIPYILISRAPSDDEDEENDNETGGLFSWVKWGVKQFGSFLLNYFCPRNLFFNKFFCPRTFKIGSNKTFFLKEDKRQQTTDNRRRTLQLID